MADVGYRIGVASSDGIVVNCHFGKARDFYIYDVKDIGDFQAVEKRSVSPVCDNGEHNDNSIIENLNKLSDCKYLLVSKIGPGASNIASSYGMEVYEIPGMIEESVDKLIRYIKVKELFN